MPVFARARETLTLLSKRIDLSGDDKTQLRVAFAPTNLTQKPLDHFGQVWSGKPPRRSTHLSPYWDKKDLTVLKAVQKLLAVKAVDDPSQRVAVVIGPRGETSFPVCSDGTIVSVHELKPLDTEMRTLHAKCLLVESRTWIAALVGSSNHTRSGLGFAKSSHREMNVWIGAPLDSKEGRALRDLIPLGKPVSLDVEPVDSVDEDEVILSSLPVCFGLCRVSRVDCHSRWTLSLDIYPTTDMPTDWSINLTDMTPVLTRVEWECQGASNQTQVAIEQATLPASLLVRWDGSDVPWAVIADDRHCLPPGPALSSLKAQHLLRALATGRSLGDIFREEREQGGLTDSVKSNIKLDPLKRLEVHRSLLRKGRELAASLGAMQRRLEQQVITLEALNARLSGPLGPEFVAIKVAEAYEAQEQSRPEALFTVAEIALTVGRVNWRHVVSHVDEKPYLDCVARTLERLADARRRIGDEPADMTAYADRAIREARRWLQG